MEHKYTLRAHHGMCLCFFKGKGYSAEFVEHMTSLSNELKEDPLIRLSNETDIVCEKCPNNDNGRCKTAEKVARYDRLVLKECGLTVGTVIRFNDFRALVCDKIINKGKRECICGDCEWNEFCF